MSGGSVCEWVGIDGWDNSALIQAGVDEIPGIGGEVVLQPWWEVLPAPQSPVFTMQIRSGDAVRVTIGQVGVGKWIITLSDLTNGTLFDTQESYDGPASSAEWVVEAETSEGGNSSRAATLAPYVPDVTFSNLGVAQAEATESTMNRVTMVQRGIAVSVPSLLQQGDFTVAYTGTPSLAPHAFTQWPAAEAATMNRAGFS
jgi:hypothetical protein